MKSYLRTITHSGHKGAYQVDVGGVSIVSPVIEFGGEYVDFVMDLENQSLHTSRLSLMESIDCNFLIQIAAFNAAVAIWKEKARHNAV